MMSQVRPTGMSPQAASAPASASSAGPKTPYDNFMESEGIRCFATIGISKVQNLPLAPWKRTGGRGSYIQLHGT